MKTTRNIGLTAVLALLASLLIPISIVATTATSGAGSADDCGKGTIQAASDNCGYDPCGNNHVNPEGVIQGGGGSNGGHGDNGCCPDGTEGHWRWGGYAGQNLYWCEAPPETPPATAEPTPTETPAVSPTAAPKKAAPKQAAAAKPTFTG